MIIWAMTDVISSRRNVLSKSIPSFRFPNCRYFRVAPFTRHENSSQAPDIRLITYHDAEEYGCALMCCESGNHACVHVSEGSHWEGDPLEMLKKATVCLCGIVKRHNHTPSITPHFVSIHSRCMQFISFTI